MCDISVHMVLLANRCSSCGYTLSLDEAAAVQFLAEKGFGVLSFVQVFVTKEASKGLFGFQAKKIQDLSRLQDFLGKDEGFVGKTMISCIIAGVTCNHNSGKSQSKYIDEFHKLVGDLAAIDTAISDEDQAFLLLTYLPSSYDNLVETLLYGRDTLKLEDVLATLNSRELQKMMEAKGDGGEGLYVRGRSGQRYMEHGTYSACTGKKQQTQVSGFGSGADGYDNADVMMAISVEELLDWIMDSGSSYYVTYRRDYLVDFKEYDGGNILLGDGRECRVRGTGTRRANCVYTLDGQAVTRKTLKGRKQLAEYQTGLLVNIRLCELVMCGGVVGLMDNLGGGGVEEGGVVGMGLWGALRGEDVGWGRGGVGVGGEGDSGRRGGRLGEGLAYGEERGEECGARLAVNSNFLVFSVSSDDMMVQSFASLVPTVAAAESAIGLAIFVITFRVRGTIAVESINSIQ
ncbi:zinc finger, CCHC-type containing protein, partial [Tanacetum coccineum]